MSSLELGFNLNGMIPVSNFSISSIGKSGNGKRGNIRITNGRLNCFQKTLKSKNKINHSINKLFLDIL